MRLKLFILLLFFCFSAFTQEKLIFHHLTPEMGLSETSITCIQQDSDGYIWIGTKDGLFRYDGANIKVYRKSRQKDNTLWNSDISFIFEDKQKTLWVFTIEGVNRYDKTSDEFNRIAFKNKKNKTFAEPITDATEDRYGNIWSASANGVVLFDKENLTFERPINGLHGNKEIRHCLKIQQDHNNNLWFAYVHNKKGGLLKYNYETKTRTVFNTQSSGIIGNDITYFAIIENDLFIGYYNHGLEVFSPSTNKTTRFTHDKNKPNSLSSDFIHNISVNQQGTIYIGTDNGLNVYDQKNGSFTRYFASSSPTTLLTNIINGIPLCDKDNTMWFPCKGGGISIYDKRFSKFSHYINDPEDKTSLGHNHVINFTEDQEGKIWISTDGGGIYRFNPVEKTFQAYTYSTNNPNSIPGNKVLAIHADTKGGLWIGTWDKGVAYYTIEGNNLILQQKYKQIDPRYPDATSVFTIFESSQNEIWLGTFNHGLYKYKNNTNTFEHITVDSIVGNQSVYAIQEDYLGNFWIGTTGQGVLFFNEEQNTARAYHYKSNDSTSLPAPTVYSIIEDKNKQLWFGTRGGGICTYNREKDEFITFTTEHGLPSNKIVGIQEDNFGNIWLSSNNGLAMMSINKTTNKLRINTRNYHIQDGLQGSFFNAWSYYKSSDGTMYFGGSNGFNAFNPGEIRINQAPPPVIITDFLLFNKPVSANQNNSPLRQHISQTEELTLNYKQSILTFKFQAINYIHNERCEYAYQLQEFEKDWNYVKNQKTATYTNLPPGQYIFKVKASNNDGLWNEEGTSLRIKILPAWYQTWLFRIVTATLSVLMLFSLYTRRVKSLQMQKDRLRLKVKERTVELQNANDNLRVKQSEIQERNKQLAVNEEELMQTNEELSNINDQLVNQRNQLEETIVKLKEAQQQLVESEKMASVGILTSGIAHEINNPLNFIMGGKVALTELFNDSETLTAEELKPFLNMISEGIDRATAIIQGLNRFNRQSDNYNESCDIHLILDNCLLVLHNTIKYEIKIEKDYHHENLIIKGNEGELHQVFVNIINNSVHALNNGGKIIIKTALVNNQIRVIIEDNGIGIPQELLPKITSPFFTTKAPGEGTGLGLSISYSIIKKHKGSMCYASEEKKGTTCTILLPLTN